MTWKPTLRREVPNQTRTLRAISSFFDTYHIPIQYTILQLLPSNGVFHGNQRKRLGDRAIGVDPHVERCATPNLDNDLHDLQLLTDEYGLD